MGAKGLRAAIASRRGEALDLLASLVGIESHASQPEGVAAAGRAVEDALAECGISWERVRGPAPPPEDAWLADLMLPGVAYERVADVHVGRRVGRGSRVLLLGDLDTAFPAGSTLRFPYRTDGRRAYGPGIADMKGGLVTLVAALWALPPSQSPTLTIVLSPDEQAGSLSSRAVIEEAARDADCCLCLECARDGGNLMAARGHIGVGRIEAYGREAHAGSAHAAGASALSALARAIVELDALTDPGAGVYVTATLAGAGWRRSVVPGRAWCVIDVRAPDAATWAALEARIAAIVAAPTVPGTRLELHLRAHRPAVPWSEGTDRLLAIAHRVGDAAGIRFGAIRSPAAGSSAFAGGIGVPTLDGMGAAGGDLMTDGEYVELASIEERALLLALTLTELSKVEPGSSLAAVSSR